MAVAQAGTMGRAANALALSQPAVSKALAGMEQTLGVKLFDRTPHGAEPTLYGRSLLKWSRVVFDDLSQGIREIQNLADPTSGEISIGSTEPMTAGLVPAVIDHMTRKFPGIVFNVVQAPTLALQYQDLRERRIDLVLGRLVSTLPDEDLEIHELFNDPLCVVAGLENKWLRRRRIDPVELLNERWCLPPYSTFVGSLLADAFRTRHLQPPKSAVVTSSIQLFNALLATGRYLSLL
jgi:DNA-binding transcriptional LysR family regulator